jgi:8-oxo-dGTP pyrophosphatase MutT (NUDIX family)
MSEKSCGAVVYQKSPNGLQFVIIRQIIGNHYGFPKGHVEANESEEMTAVREVYEETGLKVKIVSSKKVEISYTPRLGVFKRVVYFLAEAVTKKIVAQFDEIAEAFWVSKNDVLNMLTFENDRYVFEQLLEHLESEPF